MDMLSIAGGEPCFHRDGQPPLAMESRFARPDPPRPAHPRVLATHVAGFDLRADDTPVITNGYDIVALQGERRVKLARRELVESVAVL